MAIPTAASLGVAGVAAAGAWFFPFLVATLAYYHHASNDPERRPVNRENLYKEYDFIIIGMIILFVNCELFIAIIRSIILEIVANENHCVCVVKTKPK